MRERDQWGRARSRWTDNVSSNMHGWEMEKKMDGSGGEQVWSMWSWTYEFGGAVSNFFSEL